jgi:hypothetical protein
MDGEPTLAEIEQLLIRSAPQPRDAFVRDLETSLMESIAPGRRAWRGLRRPPRLVAAAGFAGAVAAVLLMLSIAGALPLDIGGAPDATADRECRTVDEWRVERIPTLSVAPDGDLQILYTTKLVLRPAIRCH